MVKTKVGGIILGGLAGYLILSKGLNVINNCVRNVCVAQQWKNYYKYGKDGCMVPPGYASHTRQINENEEQVVESPEQLAANEKAAEKGTSNKSLGASVAEAIVKAISDAFVGEKKPEGAVEGDLEASKEQDEDKTDDNVVAIDFSKNPADESAKVNEENSENETTSD